MIQLSINLNKIALIRNSRDTYHPDPCEFAATVIEAGAHGITVHPRPDQRHIRSDDCLQLGKTSLGFNRDERKGKGAPAGIEFNIEGNPFAAAQPSNRDGVSDYPGFLQLIEAVRPDQVTLVPDADDQLTSDHGFDIARDGERLAPVIEKLKSLGCRVSLFMDPDPSQIERIPALGADRIELYTESYARAHERGDFDSVLAQFQEAAVVATASGLGINAGHDLNLNNLRDFRIPNLLEVSIGHAFTIDALRWGIPETVRRYIETLSAL
ncbi:MAG: pyridoxine 5'-phosphate synthase [Congregibacter sp.]|nr:pyridoxine 5'-phosphate synthase [Congregibacter sp.]